MRQVYFDHQSAAPVLPEVLEAMQPYLGERFGHPNSLHRHGLLARDAIARAREQIAVFINAASPEEIVFTSDATEASNLAIKGTAAANQREGNHLVLSVTEHAAVLGSAESLEKQGFACTRVKVDAEGMIDPAAVRVAVTDKTILIAVHHVNHEIGTVQAVAEIGAVAREFGVAFYVDVDASVGSLPVDVQTWGASLVSFSANRFYGPRGVGVLYQNRRARVAPIMHGGVQENGLRAGLENVPAIVGAGAAAEIARRELSRRTGHAARLQERLWNGLRAGVPYLKLNGPEPGTRRHPGNLNFSTEFIEGEGQLLLCDMHGIAVASGSACAAKAQKVSHVLTAVDSDPALARGNIIMSLGQENTEEDVDYVIATFPKIVAKLREMSPLWEEFAQRKIGSVIVRSGETV